MPNHSPQVRSPFSFHDIMLTERKLISYDGVDCKCKAKNATEVNIYQAGRANGDMRVRLRHTFHSASSSNHRISCASQKNKQGRLASLRSELQSRNLLPSRAMDMYDTLRISNDSVLKLVDNLTDVLGKGATALLSTAMTSLQIVELYHRLVIDNGWVSDPKKITEAISNMDTNIAELGTFLGELDKVCEDLDGAIRTLLDVAQKGGRGYVESNRKFKTHRNSLALGNIATAVGTAGLAVVAGMDSVPTILGMAAGSMFSYRSYLFATGAQGEGKDYRQHSTYALETVRSSHYLKHAARDYFKEITLLRQRLIDARPFSDEFSTMTGEYFRACLIWMTNDELVKFYKDELMKVHINSSNIKSARENEIDRMPDGVAVMQHRFGR